MIQSLSIKNFKCFEDFQIVKPGRITLLGGDNNVGKTSVLEALLFLYGCASNNTPFAIHANRGITNLPLTPEAYWGPFFYKMDLVDKHIKLLVDNEALDVEYLPSFTPPLVGSRPDIRSNTISSETLASGFPAINIKAHFHGNIIEATHYMNLGANRLETYVHQMQLRMPTKYAYLGANAPYSHNSLIQIFGSLVKEKKENELINEITRIDPRINNLATITYGNSPVMLVDYNQERILLNNLGGGTNRLIGILAHIINCKDGIVLIDEIENGIYWSKLIPLWSAIFTVAQKYNCQVFATTHSYDCLRATIEAAGPDLQPDDFSYVRLEQLTDGKIKNTSYNIEELKTNIDDNWEVR